MPRGKKPKYVLADDGNGGLAPAPASSRACSVSGLPHVQESAGREEAASRAFQGFLERTDGWLRCIPAGDGKLSYFKWKFSSGQHRGKYVMYVTHFYDWVDGLCGLADKLDEVDRGVRNPSLDQYGGDGWDL